MRVGDFRAPYQPDKFDQICLVHCTNFIEYVWLTVHI